jgi:hypothetical protein
LVAFNDRRRSPRASLDEVLPRLPLEKGDTVGKSLIDGRYLVRGVPVETEEGDRARHYVLHEVLPSGNVVQRGEPFQSRAKAKRETRQMQPTRVIEI